MAEIYPLDVTPDRPEFDLVIDGQPIEASLRSDVREIDVRTEVGKHGRATILVQNWNPDTQEVRHSDDPPFAIGSSIEISLGYHSELVTVFAGTVTGLRLHFPGGGSPSVEVQCRTRSILLDGPRRSRVVEDATDDEMAETMASDHGLTAEVEQGFTQPVMVSADRTDWDFLVERADVLGWVTYVEGDRLVFRPPTTPDEPTVLGWGKNLIELELTQDVARRIGTAVATGWDSAELEAIEAEAAGDDAEFDTGDRPRAGAAVEETGWPLRTESRPRPLGLVSTELDRAVAGTVNRNEARHMTGHGRTIGLPALRIDRWLVIEGVGTRVGGPHYLSAVRHRLGQRGFHTEFQVGRPEPLVPPSARTDRAGRPSGIGGLTIGVVDDLDDEEGWGRVKVSFPWRTDAPQAIWARVATLDAGPGYGTYFVPDVGQEVVVGHLDDDHRFPIVLGSLWNGRSSPPVEMHPDRNQVRSIVSPGGHRIVIDDGAEAALAFTTAGGHRMVLDDANQQVSIVEAGGKNGITINSDGITIEAGSGDISIKAAQGTVKIDGTGFEAKASGSAKVESSATLDLKASATLGISGALVNIN